MGSELSHSGNCLAAEQSLTHPPRPSLEASADEESQPKPTAVNATPPRPDQPDPAQKDAVQPDAAQPDAVRPDAAQPDAAPEAPPQADSAHAPPARVNGSEQVQPQGDSIQLPKPAQSDPSSTNGSDQDKPGAAWIRILRNASGEPLALQTAIVRYQNQTASDAQQQEGKPGKLTVDLIGAIHVGDRAYYDRLNRRFREYEALLFELVAPEGTVVPRGSGTSNMHPVGAMQNGLKGILDLDHQLERIDYTRANFIHADMSPSQLAKSMQNRGESFFEMYFRLMGAEMARQSQQQFEGNFAELNIFKALFASDRTRQLKIALAREFENVETLMTGLNGPDGSSLITERNKVAIQVLAEQIQQGRQHLGIFYGAGHLPDMHKRLQDKFHLIPVAVFWLDAWDLRTGR